MTWQRQQQLYRRRAAAAAAAASVWWAVICTVSAHTSALRVLLLVLRPLHCPAGRDNRSSARPAASGSSVCPSLEIGLLGLVSGMPPFEPCFPAPQARTAAAPARLHAAFSGPAAATTTTPALAALRRPFPSFSDPLFRSVGSCIVSALCALCAALMRRIDRSSGGDGLRLSVEAGSAVGLATRRGDGGRAVRAPGARVSVSEIQAQPTQAAAAATEAATAAERR